MNLLSVKQNYVKVQNGEKNKIIKKRMENQKQESHLL